MTAPDIPRRNSGAIEPHTIASNTGKTDNIDERQPEVRPSASDVFNDGQGHNPGNSSAGDVMGGYQPSVTDVTKAHQPSSDDNQPPKSGGGTLQRIKFYPFVLFGCYLFATIRRVAEWASTDHVAPFGIAACQVFTSALLGTCNAILYGFTPVVRKKDSEWFRRKCCGAGYVIIYLYIYYIIIFIIIYNNIDKQLLAIQTGKQSKLYDLCYK